MPAEQATTHPLLAAALESIGIQSAAPPASLPRDRRMVDPQTVSDSQRWRLLQSFAHVVAEKGLARTTIDEVTAAAGVSKKTFYKFFASKDEAFLACYAAVDRLLELLAGASLPAGDLHTTIRSMTGLYLSALAAAPDLTHLFVVEALSAGPEIRLQRTQQFERFVAVVQGALQEARAAHPELPVHPDDEILALIGGVNELCVRHLARRPASTLPELEPVATAFVWRYLMGTTADS
jgi:AcrR family transcriptional regulator